MSIKDAAWQVMPAAYLAASDDGALPANARQVMYAARGDILALTGTEKLGDAYFTQTLLPDYIAAHPDECADWDVVFDARGHFVEPHTGRSIPVGTLAVREYLGERPPSGPPLALNGNDRYPTSGPENRYRNFLFVEKEGFDPLLQQSRIAERYDLAIMSTKGMSVTAARMLLDRLAPRTDRVFVLHDFDISGFSIFGTLGTDGRRYVYENAVHMIDLGLRLDDVEAMGLESEPVAVSERFARAETLRRHGATLAESMFLCFSGEDDSGRRVELNAMTSRQFISFLERRLDEHGVEKVVPDAATLSAHARRLIEQRLGEKALDEIRDRIAGEAATYPLPANLGDQVRDVLAEDRELAWDDAIAAILRED